MCDQCYIEADWDHEYNEVELDKIALEHTRNHYCIHFYHHEQSRCAENSQHCRVQSCCVHAARKKIESVKTTRRRIHFATERQCATMDETLDIYVKAGEEEGAADASYYGDDDVMCSEWERERKCATMDLEAWEIYVKAGEGAVGDAAVAAWYTARINPYYAAVLAWYGGPDVR